MKNFILPIILLIVIVSVVVVSVALLYSINNICYEKNFGVCEEGFVCKDISNAPRINTTPYYYCLPERATVEFCPLKPPDACIELYNPVIGSDGKEYTNPCFACTNPEVIYYYIYYKVI